MNLGLVFVGCHRQGGVERSVWELARAWSRHHEITVYARDFEADGLPGVVHVPVASAGPALLRPASFARGARRALRGNQHDHVISFGVGDVGADVLWVNSVHRRWLQVSSTFGEGGLRASPFRRLLPQHLLLLELERRYFRADGTAAVVVVADQVGSDLQSLYGISADRLHTVHNGFSPREFSAARCRQLRDEARADLGLGQDDVVLLVVANELARKGLPVVLDAVHELNDSRVHVVLAGRRSPQSLDPQVARLGLADRFHFAGSSADVGRLHAASDLFVLPTKYEAFCLAIVEALASGLPVITSDLPGAGDLIHDGANGRLLSDPTDSHALADLLRSGLDPERRQAWSRAATETVSALSWDILAAEGLVVLSGRPSLRSGRDTGA